MKARKLSFKEVAEKVGERGAVTVREEIGERLDDLLSRIEAYRSRQENRMTAHAKATWGGIIGCLAAALKKFNDLP